MANEWVAAERMGANRDGEPITYTVSASTSVSKGQLLCMADDNTVVATAVGLPIAGVAAEEHIAGESVTRIAVETNGKYRVTSSMAITIGAKLGASGVAENTVTSNALSTLAHDFTKTHNAITACDAVNNATEMTVRLLL